MHGLGMLGLFVTVVAAVVQSVRSRAWMGAGAMVLDVSVAALLDAGVAGAARVLFLAACGAAVLLVPRRTPGPS